MILVPVLFYQFWDVGAEAFIDDITSMFQSRVTIFGMNERLGLTLFRYKPISFSYGNYACKILVSIRTT